MKFVCICLLGIDTRGRKEVEAELRRGEVLTVCFRQAGSELSVKTAQQGCTRFGESRFSFGCLPCSCPSPCQLSRERHNPLWRSFLISMCLCALCWYLEWTLQFCGFLSLGSFLLQVLSALVFQDLQLCLLNSYFSVRLCLGSLFFIHDLESLLSYNLGATVGFILSAFHLSEIMTFVFWCLVS